MNGNRYNALAGRIIKQQENVVGSLAWVEAEKVHGVTVTNGSVEIVGDGKQVLAELVAQYEKLFGRASVEVCKDAIKPIVAELEKDMLPEVLMS